MKITRNIFLALLAGTLSSPVAGFGGGAGQCAKGGPSPGSTHLTQASITTGSLADGGYTLSVDGMPVAADSTVTVEGVGRDVLVEVTGPNFRGVLIMLVDQPASVMSPGPGLQSAEIGAGCSGTASVTHMDPSDKTSATATISLGAPVMTPLEVDVVVQNSNSVSEYYFSQVTLDVVADATAPMEPDADDAAPPSAAPTGEPAMLPPATGFSQGDEICTEGFIMDFYCINLGRLLDNSSAETLKQPDVHSVHCLVDVGDCRDSGYTILGDPAPGETMYTVDFALDQAGNDAIVDLARKVGTCDTCEDGGVIVGGLRAGIMGTVVDATTVPPIIMVNDLEVSNNVTGYCPKPANGPTPQPSPETSPTDDSGTMPLGGVRFMAVVVGLLAVAL